MKFTNMFCLIFISILIYIYPVSINAQVVIIANKNVNTQSINKNTVQNLYTLHSNELGSQKVKLFFLNENSETDGKFLLVMGMSFLELKKVWLKAKLTGNGNPPEIIQTPDELIAKIISTPGAVGFVDSKFVNNNVKVLYKIE